MSQQQPSPSSPEIPSPSFLSNSVLEVMSTNSLPDVLKSLENLTADDNLEEGNQPPTDISTAAKPQGIDDEATSGFNKEQVIKVGPNELGNESKATEEVKKRVRKRKKARIDILAKLVNDIVEPIYKKKVNGDSLKIYLARKYFCYSKAFYLNYVKDGKIINADNYNHEMRKYMKSSHNKFRYRKCVCPYCQESGIEIIGRSNFVLDHMRRTQNIKIQCVYCITDKFFSIYQRAKDHVRKYHWKFGEKIKKDKENSDE